jgi:solute carrier family 35 protein F5
MADARPLSVSRASAPSALEVSAPAATPDKNQRGSVYQWVVGCIFLFFVAVIWNFSSVLIQYIFHDLSFEAPFFLTSFGMALFSVNMPIYFATKVFLPEFKLKKQRERGEEPIKSEEEPKVVPHRGAVLKQTIRAGVIVAPLWFFANFTYNESLNMTSVTSSTILSATSSIFTLIFGVWILKERFSWLKLLGVALCMAGNCSTLANDTSDGISETFWGDLLALLGAVLYGVYTTAIRKMIPDDSGISVSLFFGFLGAASFFMLFIFVIVFHYTGVESLDNLTGEIVGLLFVQGLVNNVLADYLWAVAILYTSTTVATIGISLTVPLAIFSDWIVNDISPNYVTIISGVLVVAGFIVCGVDTRKDQLAQAAQASAEDEIEPTGVPLTPVSPATEFKEVTH